MKKKLFNGLAMLLMMVMMYSNYSMASSGSSSVTVPAGCLLVTGVSGVTRTTNYSYVQVKANSIYPTGNYDKDTFTKCKTVICKNDSTNTKISNVYTLTEGSGYTNVYIHEGYLSLAKVNICFAGNDPFLGAVVNFSYDSK
ncbi:MAG: hypothetical protein HDT40_05615 [Lachnospiraceae bacterium]|nr:hypothetical protein [Lachnospiraceae bacterium]